VDGGVGDMPAAQNTTLSQSSARNRGTISVVASRSVLRAAAVVGAETTVSKSSARNRGTAPRGVKRNASFCNGDGESRGGGVRGDGGDGAESSSRTGEVVTSLPLSSVLSGGLAAATQPIGCVDAPTAELAGDSPTRPPLRADATAVGELSSDVPTQPLWGCGVGDVAGDSSTQPPLRADATAVGELASDSKFQCVGAAGESGAGAALPPGSCKDGPTASCSVRSSPCTCTLRCCTCSPAVAASHAP
jgi:hypothetical protein